jgi:hypothetical protein
VEEKMVKRKRLYLPRLCLFSALLVLAACGSVRLVNHSEPDLAVNTDWLEKAGCTPGEGGSAWWDCTPAGPLGTLGCEQVRVDALLGGLSPSYPLVECVDYIVEPLDKPGWRREGCMVSYLRTHVTFKDDSYQLIDGAAELQPVYAPVESADKALSYALAATDLHAHYGQVVESFGRYLTNELEDTHVEEIGGGYAVHLFRAQRPLCGCGLHTVDAVDVLVTREGQVKEASSQPIWEFEACID